MTSQAAAGRRDEQPVRNEGDFGWQLGVLLSTFHTAVGPLLESLPHGMRGYQVLSTVVHGDQPTQSALAAFLGIDRTVMTYLIDDLVEAGLVERRQSTVDRRARKVVVTAAGRRVLAELERVVGDAEDDLLSALEPAQRTVFRDLLRTVACRARSIEPPADPCVAAEHLLGDSAPR
ncbi:MarR family winged helix-turn-helix transcriptional regulator [Nonomuraea jiangxiensis]|uniref:DNA-binding transcriptional regulator, MarR family n=1 Tax=Nonomuraea jiangxiensis TaxID=633440 RepID=A0A1G7ZST1_9ACTN|nr:MarR family winged helix-turn-helix transcriptional regulator [Nonomuraea jiangxiensis]SDH11743.1 DNA-binding transcriptional regulator, MarR family [Nonomuraea jiangxiensis]